MAERSRPCGRAGVPLGWRKYLERKVRMKKRQLFLQWAVMASLIVTGAIFAGKLGFFGLLEADPSRVPYIILGAFTMATAWCGWLCWQMSGGRDPEDIEVGLILGHYGS